MSNNSKPLTEQQQFEHDCINLLGSLQFVDIINQYDLPRELYNELFAAHCLTLGIMSSGIKEGSINLQYYLSTKEGFQKDIVGPQLNYAFYTVRDQLIETGIYCTNSSQRINNAEFNKAKYPRQFRDFLDQHWKNMKHMPQHTLDDFKDYAFKLEVRGKYRNRHLQIEHVYKNIVEKNHCIYSFIAWHFLQNKINIKNYDTIRKNKI